MNKYGKEIKTCNNLHEEIYHIALSMYHKVTLEFQHSPIGRGYEEFADVQRLSHY